MGTVRGLRKYNHIISLFIHLMRNRDKVAIFFLLDLAFAEWADDIYDSMIYHA